MPDMVRFTYEAELAGIGGGWTDITADVADTPQPELRYGIPGGGPEDLVAETGTLKFALANFAKGSRPLGYYSPGHPSCRAGWTHDIRIRLTAAVGGNELQNGNFADGTAGEPAGDGAGWTQLGGSDVGSWTIGANESAAKTLANEGTAFAARSGTPLANKYVAIGGSKIPVVGGTSYTWSVYLGYAGCDSAQSVIFWWNGSTYLSSSAGTAIYGSHPGGTALEDYAHTLATAQAPASATHATPGVNFSWTTAPTDPRAYWTHAWFGLASEAHIPTRKASTRWLGYLDDIDVEPGRYESRLVPCTAIDIMGHLASAPCDVAVQVSQGEADILDALLDACPTAPAVRDLDASLDTYPYALDRQSGTLLGAAQDLALSCRGYIYATRDATHGQTVRYESRSARRADVAPTLMLTDGTLAGLTLAGRSSSFDRLRATCHPRRVVPAGSMAGPVAAEEVVPNTPLAPGATETVWLDFTDPAQRDTRIAAANVLAPVATTDYTFNSVADGSGVNLTASVAVTATAFAESVKLEITNGHATLSAYRTKLQVRGDGIYTLADVTVESLTGSGTRLRVLDLPYQHDPAVAQGAADALILLYANAAALAQTVSVEGDRDHETMLAVLETDIGSAIDVVESVVGLSRRFFVQGVTWVLGERDRLLATFTVSPAPTDTPWLLGTAGRSELDSTTVLGFL